MNETFEKFRDSKGFIDLRGIPLENLEILSKIPEVKLSFTYQKEHYFYKKAIYNIEMAYHELVAYYLAEDYGIPCVYYDLALEGVISKDFKKRDKTYITMAEYLGKVYGADYQKHYNLLDIWAAFSKDFSQNAVTDVMVSLVKMFLFDKLIGNHDRHSGNIYLEIDKTNVKLAPLIDHGEMLMINHNYKYELRASNANREYLKDFLDLSAVSYLDYFKSKLWIISEENLKQVFQRIEMQIKAEIPFNIKQNILKKMALNRSRVNNIISELETTKGIHR